MAMVGAVLVGSLLTAPPAAAITSDVPLSTIAPAPPTQTGTLPNGVTWSVDRGAFSPNPTTGGWALGCNQVTTWTFSQPVNVRFGLRNIQVPGEAVRLPVGVLAESINPRHDWDPGTRTISQATGASEADESIFTLANTTTLVLTAVGGCPFGRAMSFLQVDTLAAVPSIPSKVAVVATSTSWSLGDALPGATTIDFTYGARPLSALMGDWDGDGTITVGTFELAPSSSTTRTTPAPRTSSSPSPIPGATRWPATSALR